MLSSLSLVIFVYVTRVINGVPWRSGNFLCCTRKNLLQFAAYTLYLWAFRRLFFATDVSGNFNGEVIFRVETQKLKLAFAMLLRTHQLFYPIQEVSRSFFSCYFTWNISSRESLIWAYKPLRRNALRHLYITLPDATRPKAYFNSKALFISTRYLHEWFTFRRLETLCAFVN